MNIAAIAAGIGGKKMQGFVKRAGALASQIKQDTSKPGHVHNDNSNDSSNNVDGGAISQFGTGLTGGMEPELPGGRPELAQNFMDADMESFSKLTDPFSVDQKGRAVSSNKLDPVGIEPAMNPPFSVPIQGNQSEELEGLYS